MADGFWSIKKGLNFTGFTMPTNPVNGDVYYDSVQGFLGYQNGSWGPLGGGGVINYNTNPTLGSTNGYNLYNDGASSIPVDGTGGTVTNLTLTSTQTSPLVGHSMGILTKAAANAQGEGFSYDFTIDSGYQAAVINVNFTYQASANFQLSSGMAGSDSDVELWVYDITNAVLIPVTPYQLTAGVVAPTQFNGYFQTNPNSTSYRLIWHIATTNASAWTFNIANVVISPNSFAASNSNDVVAALIGYTGSFAISTSATETIPFDQTIFDTTSSYNPSTFLWTAPSSGYYDIKAQFFVSYGAHDNIICIIRVNGTTISYGQNCVATLAAPAIGVQQTIATSTNYFLKAGDTVDVAVEELNGIAGQTLGNGSITSTFLAINKIQGSSSSASPSPVAKMVAQWNAGTVPSPNTTIVFNSTLEDSYGSYNNTTGIYTVPVSGVYLIHAVIDAGQVTSHDAAIALVVNGTQIAWGEFGGQIASTQSYVYSVYVTRHVTLQAGDQVRIDYTGVTLGGLSGGAIANYLDIIQLLPADNRQDTGLPIGTLLDLAAVALPNNYLFVDGSSLLISDYPQLAVALFDPSTGNYAFGSADSLHFNLPPGGLFYRSVDYANAFDPDSASRGAAAPGGNTGNKVGSFQNTQNLSHAHTGPNVNNTNPGASSAFGSGRTGSWTTDASGGNQSNPYNVYVNKIIKYR